MMPTWPLLGAVHIGTHAPKCQPNLCEWPGTTVDETVTVAIFRLISGNPIRSWNLVSVRILNITD